jgi:hypothetical protein
VNLTAQPGGAQLLAQLLRPFSRRQTLGNFHVRKRRELPDSPRLEPLGFNPDGPRQDLLGPVAVAQLPDVVDASSSGATTPLPRSCSGTASGATSSAVALTVIQPTLNGSSIRSVTCTGAWDGFPGTV